jgi:dihydrolipoamide dehydrogenase
MNRLHSTQLLECSHPIGLVRIGAIPSIEMDAADIGLTIHPHPTLSETIGVDAEPFEGTITDCTYPGRMRTERTS